MIYRFTLNNSILGSHEISELDGWEDAKLKLERDKNFHSLVEYFDGSFIFYGNNGVVDGGYDYINEVDQTQGPDAVLEITIELSLNGYSYTTLFNGLVKMDSIVRLGNNQIQAAIVPNDFWSKFINRLETPVNIQSEESLDGDVMNVFDSINLSLSSQKIQKSYYGIWQYGEKASITPSQYLQATPNTIKLDEIEESFWLPYSSNPEIPVDFMSIIEAGSYHINVQLCVAAVNNQDADTIGYDTQWNWFISINETQYPLTNSGPINSFPVQYVQYNIDLIIDLLVGDEIRLYAEEVFNLGTVWVIIGVDGHPGLDLPGGGVFIKPNITDQEIPSFIRITAQTVFPETNSPSFLLHDAGGQILDRIISRDNTFYSELLGGQNTVYRQYDADGCQWPNAIAKGLQIRQYSLAEKPFFLSFKEWWDGANPIFNLSLGYETINDEEVIRIEGKEYQYNETPSVYISNVREITSVYDQERIFKTVKIGYKKWQSEDVSGIDDPQTKHTYASRLQKTGTDIALESEFIAASLAIETTRRKTREKSADYKFDNDTFIVAINPNSVDVSPETSPDVTDYVPELDENFTNIENLLNSDTRYNIRLTPARNLLRWLGWLSGGLQSYLGSFLKFTSGEGNYDTISDYSSTSCEEYQAELSEKQDIEISGDYYHLANLYEINVPMELSTYLTIRENRKNAIAISQTTTDHKIFFIRELDYYPAKGTATIKAWSKEFFDIVFVNQARELVTCAPVANLTVDSDQITVDSTEITADQTEYTL